ncbi:MAG TPA: 16S rRNA (adenine(1518)-N(6)/adenine(1519)-N(6))-dimethyltransferase RsmA [Polyangiaceae bacterium]|nr:16S rRNA (adenine(1518)-N(6)/adenine(1519)-N(6))-dimethyltransferase RsmA [Polyangiaceae bacterium]
MSAEDRPFTTAARHAFRERGLAAKKSFGQNFLVDPGMARQIAELAAFRQGATVVEVGAGLGALTEPLLACGAHVIAVERDRDLCPILREAFAGPIADGTLVVLEADAKQVDYRALLAEGSAPRVIAGNLPYQLTGPLLELTTGVAGAIDRAVFMVQAEVANRLVAAPSTEDYGALTVFVNAAFRVTRALTVGRGAFHPRPGVDSAVVILTPVVPRRAEETETFRAAVRAAFAQRRKTLRNAWRALGAAPSVAACAQTAGIDLDRRGETLSVEEFARFAGELARQ